MEHSCGFVLFRQVGKNRYYLLMHYKAGHWDFPKGHIEEGETQIQTACRELEEETGIRDVTVVPGFKYEYSYDFGKDSKKSKKVTFMIARTSHIHIRLSREHIGARWVPYKRGVSMLTFENAKKMIDAAESFLEGREKEYEMQE